MSDFIPYEKEETKDWLERQSAFSSSKPKRGEGHFDADDVVHRGGVVPRAGSPANLHPEHMADFRRFALNKNKSKLFVVRFDVYVANIGDLATKFSPLIPKDAEGGDELLHPMFQQEDMLTIEAKDGDVYLVLKGYNESADQFEDNKDNRDGGPWFIAEEAWVEIFKDAQADEHGEVGEEDIKKYVKIGAVDKKKGCETYIGQEMYLSYQAPTPGGSTFGPTPWWEPKLTKRKGEWTLTIGKGCNLVPSDANGDKENICPESYWKSEFPWLKGKKVAALWKDNYFWVSKTFKHNRDTGESDGDGNPEETGYLVADRIVHQTEEEEFNEEYCVVPGSIRSHYLVSKVKNGVHDGNTVDASYYLSHLDHFDKPTDTEFTKYQFLGVIKFDGAAHPQKARKLLEFEWRINHTFYWNHMNFPVGSFGDTSGPAGDGVSITPGGAGGGEVGIDFVPGAAGNT